MKKTTLFFLVLCFMSVYVFADNVMHPNYLPARNPQIMAVSNSANSFTLVPGTNLKSAPIGVITAVSTDGHDIYYAYSNSPASYGLWQATRGQLQIITTLPSGSAATGYLNTGFWISNTYTAAGSNTITVSVDLQQ